MCLPLRDAVPHAAGILLYGKCFMMEKMMDLDQWLDKSNSIKKYAHFDRQVSIKTVWDEIREPQNIITHACLPFIHSPLIFHKYSKNKGRKDKIRQLYYSSHYDRCIYQYYSYLLNERYNIKADEVGINQTSIAYRTNLHKSNIHFAKEAFDFIKEQRRCFIIVGDFKDFFDSLDHSYLKSQLCSVLGTERLPEDYYKVFRSITKYSYVDFSDILNYYRMPDTVTSRRKLNKKDIILPIQTLRRMDIINSNKENYGIPQGSAISAVLSNVYMLEFDQNVNAYIKTYNGKYLRYSDDTIFILPVTAESEIQQIHLEIRNIISKIPNLTLQAEKTKLYYYNEGNLENRDFLIDGRANDKNIIDYLGFSFDGKNIYLRDKTISKYYYRMYKKADTVVKCKGISPKGNIISNKNLYKTYSLKGANSSEISKGNFLSYVKRCKRVFGANEKVIKVLNTHYGKIKKRLKRIK